MALKVSLKAVAQAWAFALTSHLERRNIVLHRFNILNLQGRYRTTVYSFPILGDIHLRTRVKQGPVRQSFFSGKTTEEFPEDIDVDIPDGPVHASLHLHKQDLDDQVPLATMKDGHFVKYFLPRNEDVAFYADSTNAASFMVWKDKATDEYNIVRNIHEKLMFIDHKRKTITMFHKCPLYSSEHLASKWRRTYFNHLTTRTCYILL